MAITAFLSRSPGLLNRGPGGPASLGAGSLTVSYLQLVWTPTNWTSWALSYIIVRRLPSSCGHHKSHSFNPSTVKVISWYSSTGCTCYLRRCISYFDSLTGVNILHLWQPVKEKENSEFKLTPLKNWSWVTSCLLWRSCATKMFEIYGPACSFINLSRIIRPRQIFYKSLEIPPPGNKPIFNWWSLLFLSFLRTHFCFKLRISSFMRNH